MSAPRSRRLQRKACVSHFFFFLFFPLTPVCLDIGTFHIQHPTAHPLTSSIPICSLLGFPQQHALRFCCHIHMALHNSDSKEHSVLTRCHWKSSVSISSVTMLDSLRNACMCYRMWAEIHLGLWLLLLPPARKQVWGISWPGRVKNNEELAAAVVTRTCLVQSRWTLQVISLANSRINQRHMYLLGCYYFSTTLHLLH